MPAINAPKRENLPSKYVQFLPSMFQDVFQGFNNLDGLFFGEGPDI